MHKPRERYDSGWEALKLGLALLAIAVPLIGIIAVEAEPPVTEMVLLTVSLLTAPLIPIFYGAILVYLNRGTKIAV